MLTKLNHRRGGFTLVEIMIVVAIIALLAAIAVPSALRARKRSQATSTLETLRILDAACDQWAIENGQSPGATPTDSQLAAYVKTGTKLYTDLQAGSATDALGNNCTMPKVDTQPYVNTATFGALSDVAPSNFWGAYYNAGS
ncbi:MAG TPA: prepilin-type N-terminal cleavage/methylation domain-containing protein [Chthoniobacter sp.]